MRVILQTFAVALMVLSISAQIPAAACTVESMSSNSPSCCCHAPDEPDTCCTDGASCSVMPSRANAEPVAVASVEVVPVCAFVEIGQIDAPILSTADQAVFHTGDVSAPHTLPLIQSTFLLL